MIPLLLGVWLGDDSELVAKGATWKKNKGSRPGKTYDEARARTM